MDFHRCGTPNVHPGIRLRARRRATPDIDTQSMNETSTSPAQTGKSTALHDGSSAARASVLFAEQNDANLRRTDRWFASLLIVEWLVGILFALTISPTTSAGRFTETHIHVWAALFLGGALGALPLARALIPPGAPGTRDTLPGAQMRPRAP